MNAKMKLITISFLILFGIGKGFSKTSLHLIQKNLLVEVTTLGKATDSTGIVVGTQNADSTGTASVSNVVIQQSIASTITFLNNTTISSDAPSIFVGKEHSYLIFKTSNSTASFKVAVELTLVGNTFKFQNSVSGKQIHICKDASECSTCDFFKDENNTITGCGCSSDNVAGGGGCQQFFFFTHQ